MDRINSTDREKQVELLGKDPFGKNHFDRGDNTSQKCLSSFDEVQDVRLDDSVAKISVKEGEIKSKDNKLLGILYMIATGLSFSLSAITCKLAYERNEHLNGLDYVLCRSIILPICSIFQVVSTKVNVFDVKKEYRMLLALRCIIGGIGMPCLFIALKHIPLSLSILIVNINPLLVAIAAFFILKEKLTKLNVIGAFGAFIGVYLLTLHKSGGDQDNPYYLLGIFLVFINCCCQTSINILLRVLNKELHYTMSPFWFSITTVIISISLLLCYPSVFNFEYYTYLDISLFLLSGVFNYGVQVGKSLAFKYADASLVSPLQYFNVLYLFISDVFIFNCSFTVTDGFGGMIILVSLLLPIFQTIHQKYSKS
ncbi:unnamed protein product [Moneuplotes crassus]|uniref:EamA domain-containing protein n=1 Tax=Euplotes crassus TaxID=5936 RepID=A0AAD2CVR2_EUPCR|nr:unnamed protein product [Moneuplotes crassus]